MPHGKPSYTVKCRHLVSLTIVLALLMTIVSACANEQPLISVSKGKYSEYYHLSFTLTTSNASLNLKTPAEDRINRFEEENGQFEVYIDKASFPINAPNCNGAIILRMPATNPNGDEPEKSIQEKRRVFNKISAMINSKQGEAEVIIELNPYVKKVGDNPLKLELTQCNVFFRQARNHYVDSIGHSK